MSGWIKTRGEWTSVPFRHTSYFKVWKLGLQGQPIATHSHESLAMNQNSEIYELWMALWLNMTWPAVMLVCVWSLGWFPKYQLLYREEDSSSLMMDLQPCIVLDMPTCFSAFWFIFLPAIFRGTTTAQVEVIKVGIFSMYNVHPRSVSVTYIWIYKSFS